MKKDIHPNYRKVAFEDISTGDKFIIGSSVKTRDKVTIDGQEYPLYKVEVSSKTHPFYTGKKTFVTALGRVDKFKKKYNQPDSE